MNLSTLISGLSLCALLGACSTPQPASLSEADRQSAREALLHQYPNADADRIQTGVNQVANFWRESDGDAEVFKTFCVEAFLASPDQRTRFMERFSSHWEVFQGRFNQMLVELMEPVHVDRGLIDPLDEIFGSMNPQAHLSDDLFSNKIAFRVLLNFKSYSLAEKDSLGGQWNRQQWAEARMGDLFVARVPSEIMQKMTEAEANADQYIASYNICMGQVRNEDNQALFPEGMNLITHWGLRDELKSQYTPADGLQRQEMIYQIMKRIIDQDIPKEVINDSKMLWKPISNTVSDGNQYIEVNPEDGARYQHLINIFQASKAIDSYYPNYENYIQNKFEGNMEMSQETVEVLFEELMCSPVLKEVGALIAKRLGRELRPFDIWYNGFKSKSSISESTLDQQTQSRYPNPTAVQHDLKRWLTTFGFGADLAESIVNQIHVDPSRGAGHAWGALMKGDKARLRTRIGEKGMNYKGFNIAVHEFGHNVEQTISLYHMDHYLLNGVPNTSFTEALAFMFQKRDLQILGYNTKDASAEDMQALDIFWSTFEIMGVAMVDMKVWQWMYAHPQADAKALQAAVIEIAKEVWNRYYQPVFGMADEPILAIYSHMVSSALYLPAYPLGHLIDFQLEKHISTRHFADEVYRIFKIGRITPKHWMLEAVGEPLSSKPLVDAAAMAVRRVSKP